jgi:ABC-type lipoprotein release transport system permease subunit
MKNYKIPYKELLKIHLEDKSTRRFLVAVIVSLAFSIAVIISTISLMDGYEKTLKNSLRTILGDYYVSSHNGFFEWNRKIVDKILKYELFPSPSVETEGYAVNESESIGVLIKGINDSYSRIFNDNYTLYHNEAIVGSDLAKKFNLKIGDEVPIMIAPHSSKEIEPLYLMVKVKKIVTSGLYEKDLRVIYVFEKYLRDNQKIKEGFYNSIVFKDNNPKIKENYEKRLKYLQNELQDEFNLRPFYAEFDTMIKAVEVEKLSMTLILQLIVIVAVFNLFGFIIFLMEKKFQTYFLLRSFGMALAQYKKFWTISIIWIWLASIILSLFFVKIFSWSLLNLKIFELPGDIYLMGRIQLYVNPLSAAVIFLLAFFWIYILKIFVFWKFNKKNISLALKEGDL